MNKQLNFSLLFLINLLLVAETTFGGSKNLFQKGDSGFDVSGSFSSSNDITTIGVAPFYSVDSQVDFGFLVQRSSFDEKEYGFELSSTAIAPFIGIQVLKQSPQMPVSLTLRAAYEIDNFQGDALDMYDYEMKGSALHIGGNIYGEIFLSNNVGLIPSFGINYVNGTIELIDTYYDDSEKEQSSSTAYSIGMCFKFNIQNNSFIYIDPKFAFNDDGNAFTVSAGIGIPTKIAHRNISPSYPKQEQELSQLFASYVKIEKVVGKYILVTSQADTPFKEGSTYQIVKKQGQDYTYIGFAKVVRIQGNKVALQYSVSNPNNSLENNTFIMYQ